MNRRELWLIATLFAIFALSASWLPSLGLDVYASPDETAHAVSASQWRLTGTVFRPDSLVLNAPFAHPRSWVTVSGGIVPVGFLGWTGLLALLSFFGSWIVPWSGAIVLLSAIWPLYKLFRSRFGLTASWLGVFVAYAHPAMILYTNRGLFPNGPFLALAIWSLWLGRRIHGGQSHGAWSFLFGLVSALTIAIRPIEMIWALPWMIWSVWGWKSTKRQLLFACTGFIAVASLFGWMANQAYGSPWAIGYWLRDPVLETGTLQAIGLSSDEAAKQTATFLPYGIHPRAIVYNTWHFLGGLVWPWSAILLVSGFIVWRRRFDAVPWLSVWTAGCLIIFYGSGRYLDHVDPQAIAIGNSFLRYLLPLAPIAGLAFAALYDQYDGWRSLRIVATAWVAVLGIFGLFRAVWADDEGLAATRRELVRYAVIRRETLTLFDADTLIASERSDKIFFPTFHAVSPLPKPEDLARVVLQGRRVGLFIRPPSQDDRDGWRAVGVELQERASYGREMMYELVSLNR